MSRTISLRIFKNEQLVASRSFSQDVIKIGKLRSSDLHLEDDTIARMHAVLEVTANDIRLIDLGSAAGTSINGQRVSKNAPIASGQSLCVGPFRIELQAPPVAAAVTSAAPVASAPSFAPAAPSAAAGFSAAMAVAPVYAPAPAPVSPRATLPVDTSEVEQPERQVAEVVTRYGNTVLDVQHVGQVRSRTRQAPAFLALGGLMLLAGAGIVANEVSQDWAGHQEASAQAHAAGRPAPQAPGMGLGGLGVGLALLGLVPLGLGAMRRQDVGLDRYTLGEGHEASFPMVAGLPDGEAFPLVSKQGDDYVLQFTPHMRGHVSVGGQRHGLDELVRAGRVGVVGSAYAMPLPHGAQVHIEHEGVTYEVASVAGGKAIARKNEADKPFWIYNAASGAVLGSLLALVHLVPEDALNMNMDQLVAENRFVGYMQQPDEQPEPEEVVVTPDANQEDTGGKGQRHAQAEGKMGNPKTTSKAAGVYAMKGDKSAIQQMARNFDPEHTARTAGILGLMERESGHFLASPYGAAYANGSDDEDVWGNMTGTNVGDAFGVAGLGGIGTGRGGGGTGAGTVGYGNTGLIGKGGGGGDRTGYGTGSGTGFDKRPPRVPQIRQGKAKIDGTIDKDVIRRIVRNHHNEVRHCYNAGLAKDPNLQGRVAVMFTIGPAGTVPSAAVSENTLSDRNVANCVAASVRRWKFPKPQTGGTAMVTYPFQFSPG